MANPRICSIPNCSKRFMARGFCSPHYRRFRLYGDPLGGSTVRGEPMAFFKSVVLPYTGQECLVWPYARITAGYGELVVGGRPRHVHRLVCEHAHGPAPTPKHQAAHSCGKGHEGCCAKGHLSWKTRTGNKADELTHGTRNRGARNGQAKLIASDVIEIRAMAGSMLQRDLARKFGVSESLIGLIQNRKRWDWL